MTLLDRCANLCVSAAAAWFSLPLLSTSLAHCLVRWFAVAAPTSTDNDSNNAFLLFFSCGLRRRHPSLFCRSSPIPIPIPSAAERGARVRVAGVALVRISMLRVRLAMRSTPLVSSKQEAFRFNIAHSELPHTNQCDRYPVKASRILQIPHSK